MNISNELNFSDTNASTNATDEMSMALGPRIFWDILFGSMIFVAVVGNLIVLWIVAAHRSMWVVPNAFIANMSLADLMLASLNCSFNFVTMRDRKWVFGSTYCTFNNFMAIVTVAASVLNLTAMSLDRYKAIVWPFSRRNSKFVVATTICCIWIWSCLIAIPFLLYSTITGTSEAEYCVMMWPDADEITGASLSDYIYNVAILLITYIIPIIIISISTAHMSIVLWWRQPATSINTPQLERAKRKKQKIVKMLVVLILIFGICWLPYHVYFLYSYHNPDVALIKYIQHIFLGFYWCAMAHSMVNPLVYYMMNPKFRHYYQHVVFLRWLKPSRNLNSVGLILASTFGMEVAAHLAYGANGEPVGATTTTTEQNENNTSTANTNQIQKLNATKDDEISKIEVNSPRIPIKNPTVVRFDLENNDSSNSVNNKTEVGQKGYLGPIRSTMNRRLSHFRSKKPKDSVDERADRELDHGKKAMLAVLKRREEMMADDLMEIEPEHEIETLALW